MAEELKTILEDDGDASPQPDASDEPTVADLQAELSKYKAEYDKLLPSYTQQSQQLSDLINTLARANVEVRQNSTGGVELVARDIPTPQTQTQTPTPPPTPPMADVDDWFDPLQTQRVDDAAQKLKPHIEQVVASRVHEEMSRLMEQYQMPMNHQMAEMRHEWAKRQYYDAAQELAKNPYFRQYGREIDEVMQRYTADAAGYQNWLRDPAGVLQDIFDRVLGQKMREGKISPISTSRLPVPHAERGGALPNNGGDNESGGVGDLGLTEREESVLGRLIQSGVLKKEGRENIKKGLQNIRGGR